MKQLLAALSVIIFFTSCAVGEKKVFVLGSGSINVDTENRKITTSGKGHNESTVSFHDEGTTGLEITSLAGNATVNVEGTGIFIINAKADTIVGSWVNYTAPKKAVEQISEEELRANIDSLQQIIDGKVSADKKTFYILPNHAVKVTGNTAAHIVTPFHQMTSIEVKKGETPEVYRFYMISEARATLQKLKNFLGESDEPVNEPSEK
jgi:hypothetical protein